jgi:cytochrome c oxidase subunit 2
MRYWCVSISFFSALTLGAEPDRQVIQVTAKKYEFSPSCVHVKAGTKVQLKITAIDHDHGFKIAIVSDDVASSDHPGLEFTSPEGNDGWKLKKGRETTIEFSAKTPGTYAFRCSVACGIHHGRMRGQLVVDP